MISLKYGARLRKRSGGALVEAAVCFIVFIPIAFMAMDLAMLIATAHKNEEFAEQLARLCATLIDKKNALKACQDVVSQYEITSNIISVDLESVNFDVGIERVTVATSMTVKLPIPFPGFSIKRLVASATQPIVGIPAQ